MKNFTLLFSAALFAANVFAADKYVTVAQGGPLVEGTFENVIPTMANGDILKFNIPGTDEIITTTQVSLPMAAGNVFVIDGINEATGNRITAKSDGVVGHAFFKGMNNAAAASMNVTFRNLIIKDYKTTANGGAFSVGHSSLGILAHPTFTIENCEISGCKATCPDGSSGGGGAIFNGRGVLVVLKNCAILNDTVALLTASLSKNMGGAGVGCTSSDGEFVFINTTFYGNVCTGAGRGGAVYTGYPTIAINCTFANNTAVVGGGGYYATNGIQKIANCIFAKNITPEAAIATADFHYVSATVTSMIYNSIGGNVSKNGDLVLGLDWTANSNKLYVAGSDTLFESDGRGVPVLKDNGGKTKTVALSDISIAARMGTPVLTSDFGTYTVPTTDQRGTARSASAPSVGAYEYVPSTSLASETVKDLDVYTISNKIVLNTNVAGTCFILNGSGALVYQESINGASMLNKSFAPGLYFVKVVSKDNSSSEIIKVMIK